MFGAGDCSEGWFAWLSGEGGVARSGGSGRGDRRGRFLFVVVEMLFYLSAYLFTNYVFHGGFECGTGEVLVEKSRRVVGSIWGWGLGGSGMGNSIHSGR